MGKKRGEKNSRAYYKRGGAVAKVRQDPIAQTPWKAPNSPIVQTKGSKFLKKRSGPGTKSKQAGKNHGFLTNSRKGMKKSNTKGLRRTTHLCHYRMEGVQETGG